MGRSRGRQKSETYLVAVQIPADFRKFVSSSFQRTSSISVSSYHDLCVQLGFLHPLGPMGNARSSGLFDCNGDRDAPPPSHEGCFGGRGGTPNGGNRARGGGVECSLGRDLYWQHVQDYAEAGLKRLHASSRTFTSGDGKVHERRTAANDNAERERNAATGAMLNKRLEAAKSHRCARGHASHDAFDDPFGERALGLAPPSFNEVFFGGLKGGLAGTVMKRRQGSSAQMEGNRLQHNEVGLYHNGDGEAQRFRPNSGGSPAKKTGRHAGNSSHLSAYDVRAFNSSLWENDGSRLRRF